MKKVIFFSLLSFLNLIVSAAHYLNVRPVDKISHSNSTLLNLLESLKESQGGVEVSTKAGSMFIVKKEQADLSRINNRLTVDEIMEKIKNNESGTFLFDLPPVYGVTLTEKIVLKISIFNSAVKSVPQNKLIPTTQEIEQAYKRLRDPDKE